MTMRCPMRANMAGELAACDHECAWYSDGACVFTVRVTCAEPESEAYERGYNDGLRANTRAAFSAARQAVSDGTSQTDADVTYSRDILRASLVDQRGEVLP